MFRLPADSKPTAINIEKAVKYNLEIEEELTNLADYYLGKHAILSRPRELTSINNKVVVNHAKYIADLNTGYLVGNPVEYSTTDGIKIDSIKDAYGKQQIDYVDHEIAKGMSKFGYCYDYTYANGDNELKTVYIDPRKCILVFDDTFDKKPLFAVLYSKVVKNKKDELVYYNLFVVTDKEIIKYNEKLERISSEAHNIGIVPVNLFLNNEDGLGDYEVVLRLMDAYNVIQSDRINDKEQLVNAILVLSGAQVTDKLKKLLRESRLLNIPKDARAEFIAKELDETQMDVLRKALKEEIHKISMTPDLSDENFTGNASGVAIRYKLFGFELNTKNKERFMKKSLADRFYLYSVYLKKVAKPTTQEIVYPHQVQVIFKRRLPQNDFEMSQTILNLENKVSDETLISQLSFVEDSKKELAWVAEEEKKNANLESQDFGIDNTQKK